MIFSLLLLIVVSGNAIASADPDSLLHTLGYSIIPTPQQVELTSNNILLDESWKIISNVGDDISVAQLIQYVKKFHRLKFNGSSSKKIILTIEPGIVKGTNDSELNKQGYLLKISPQEVRVIGNSKAGLFYGVQSLLQLFKKAGPGQLLLLPEGEIRDWPNLQLRMIHWDTKNHLDRIAALKEYIDRLARIKINIISFEIWDKFKFPTDPEIGVKEGFTPDQLQDLVNYGLERYIQIVPNIQAPAHMQWVLSLPKYAHLRADGSDYQACMCDEETYKLIFSLYQDVINATKGVGYFHASTDEVYYAGICKKCSPYNRENSSLTFVDFVNKAHNYLAKQNRRMIFWGEWPLAPEHIKLLPKDIIEGVLGSSYFVDRIEPLTEESYITEENHLGIRQLIYTAQAASLAPVNFSVGGGQSMENLYRWFTIKAKRGNPIGSFGAGWDDLGPHSELYWLGWTAVSAFSWNTGSPKNIERFVVKFMEDFYGPQVHGMVDIYRDMNKLSDFWNQSWDKVVNDVPGTGSTRESYGNSDGKYSYPHPLTTYTLAPPAIPFTEGLNVRPIYANGNYKDLVTESVSMEQLATSVIYRLEENRVKAAQNDYNLRVLLTLTRYLRHHARLLLSMAEIEKKLQTAEQKAAIGDANGAVQALLFANGLAKNNIYEREETIDDMKAVFSETRVPGYLTVESRYFGQEKTIGIDSWVVKLKEITLHYASKNKLDIMPLQNILDKVIYTGENTGE